MNSATKYLQSCLGRIALHLKKFKVRQQEADIHQVRVNIKRFRAVLRMLNKLKKTGYSFNGLDLLFKDAGALRELHIDIKVLRQNQKHHSKLVDRLNKKLNSREKHFLKHIPDYITKLNKIEEKLQDHAISWPAAMQVKKYLNELSWSHLRLPLKKRKQLHHLRTELKRIQYINQALPFKLKSAIKLQQKSLEILQERIGSWHDLYVTVELLKKYKLNKKKNFTGLIKNEKHAFNSLIENFQSGITTVMFR